VLKCLGREVQVQGLPRFAADVLLRVEFGVVEASRRRGVVSGGLRLVCRRSFRLSLRVACGGVCACAVLWVCVASWRRLGLWLWCVDLETIGW
jgi:hypothetical protein